MERIKALDSVEPDVISYNSLVYALVQEPWVFEASVSPRRTLPTTKVDLHSHTYVGNSCILWVPCVIMPPP